MTHKDIQLPVAKGVTDGPALRAEYERGFIDGMQAQARRSVDRAVNAMTREWVTLEVNDMPDGEDPMYDHPFFISGMAWAAGKLKEKNHG